MAKDEYNFKSSVKTSRQNSIVDATGVSFSLSRTPKRVVSLAPSITESLFRLRVGHKLVGITVHCQVPESSYNPHRIGTLLNPDVEKIVSLVPDMVFATKEGNDPRAIRKLREVNLIVFVLDETEGFRDICENFLTLASIMRSSSRAYEVIDSLRRRIRWVRDAVSGREKVTVFWQLSSSPLITASGRTFANEMIEIAGGVNIAKDAPGKYPILNIEQILKRDPDVIVFSDMEGGSIDAQLDRWKKFGNLTAVSEGRIYRIEARLICQPSPFAFVEGVESLAKFFHPSAFLQGYSSD